MSVFILHFGAKTLNYRLLIGQFWLKDMHICWLVHTMVRQFRRSLFSKISLRNFNTCFARNNYALPSYPSDKKISKWFSSARLGYSHTNFRGHTSTSKFLFIVVFDNRHAVWLWVIGTTVSMKWKGCKDRHLRRN